MHKRASSAHDRARLTYSFTCSLLFSSKHMLEQVQMNLFNFQLKANKPSQISKWFDSLFILKIFSFLLTAVCVCVCVVPQNHIIRMRYSEPKTSSSSSYSDRIFMFLAINNRKAARKCLTTDFSFYAEHKVRLSLYLIIFSILYVCFLLFRIIFRFHTLFLNRRLYFFFLFCVFVFMESKVAIKPEYKSIS